MSEHRVIDMQIAVARMDRSNCGTVPYPLTMKQWAALRSAPTKIERLEADLGYGIAANEECAKANEALRAEVERLKGAETILIDKLQSAVVKGHYRGMKAAAGIPKPQYPAHEADAGYVSGWNEACSAFRQDIRALSKQQAGEAGSRELLPPAAAESSGSASPVDSREQADDR